MVGEVGMVATTAQLKLCLFFCVQRSHCWGHHLDFFDHSLQIPLVPMDFPGKMHSAAHQSCARCSGTAPGARYTQSCRCPGR